MDNLDNDNSIKGGIITTPPPREGVNTSWELFISSLEQPTRGAQIFVYSVAGIGLALAVYKIRPISKFSRAADVPEHFIRQKELLVGKVVGCEPAPGGAKLLVDHKPLISIPLWHSSKPPLPIKIWGVNLAGGNSISWLQFVTIGRKVSFVPIQKQGDSLVADVTLHFPILAPIKPADTAKTVVKKKKTPEFEDIVVGQRLLELGLATVSDEIPKPKWQANWWTPWILNQSLPAVLFRAQNKAVSSRSGIWQQRIPVSKFQILQLFAKKVMPSGSS